MITFKSNILFEVGLYSIRHSDLTLSFKSIILLWPHVTLFIIKIIRFQIHSLSLISKYNVLGNIMSTTKLRQRRQN